MMVVRTIDEAWDFDSILGSHCLSGSPVLTCAIVEPFVIRIGDVKGDDDTGILALPHLQRHSLSPRPLL